MLERLFGKKRTKPSHSDATTTSTESPSAVAASEAPASSTSPESVADLAPSAGAPASGPTPAHELERAMIANVAMDNPDTRLRVYQELLFSELLLAVADDPISDPAAPDQALKNGQTVEASNVRVAILKNASNIQFAVAFTSGEAAARWRPEGGQYISIKGQEIFKLLDASPAEVIVVNPASLPFVVLPKIDYRQLAMGVVPQNSQTPVQNPPPQPKESGVSQRQASGPGESSGADADANQQMQIAFPPDVFNDEQKSFIKTLLLVHTQVEAASFGALKPPGTQENEWIRTIFLRVRHVEQTQEAVQGLSGEIKQSILGNQELFKGIGFEVGVMPDPQFWVAMHENNLIVIDKNPPTVASAPQGNAKPSGVVDAKTDTSS